MKSNISLYSERKWRSSNEILRKTLAILQLILETMFRIVTQDMGNSKSRQSYIHSETIIYIVIQSAKAPLEKLQN